MREQDRHAAGTYCSLFVTDLGVGGVVATDQGLVEICLPFGGEGKEGMTAWLADRHPAALAESPVTRRAADLLACYFTGEPVIFDLPIDWQGFTPFQSAVYRLVMTIPAGEVRSYSQVAAEIGRPRGARGIGGAMARNPLPVVIPCHRVVGKSGRMTGYSAPGGIASKEWLLTMEKKVAREKSEQKRGAF